MNDWVNLLWVWEWGAYALIVLVGVYLMVCFLFSFTRKSDAGPMTAFPFISVVIPIYKESPETLRPVLDSWAAVDYPNWELIVADDTPVKPAVEYPPWVRVIRRDHREGYKGGALRAASEQLSPRAEWMAVFDGDARVLPGALRRAATHFAPGVAIVQGYQRQSSSGGMGRRTDLLARFVMGTHWIANRLLYGRWLMGGFVCSQGTSMFYRLSSVRSIGGLAPYVTANEDLDTSFRLKQAGHKVIYDPELVGDGEAPLTVRHFVHQQIRWTSSTVREYRRHFIGFVRSSKPSRKEKVDSALFLLTWVLGLVVTPTLAFIPILFPLSSITGSFRWSWPGLLHAWPLWLPALYPLVIFTGYGIARKSTKEAVTSLAAYFALLFIGYFIAFYSIFLGLTTDCPGFRVTPRSDSTVHLPHRPVP